MSKLSDKIDEGGAVGRNVDAFHTELFLDLEARIEALENAKAPEKPTADKPA